MRALGRTCLGLSPSSVLQYTCTKIYHESLLDAVAVLTCSSDPRLTTMPRVKATTEVHANLLRKSSRHVYTCEHVHQRHFRRSRKPINRRVQGERFGSAHVPRVHTLSCLLTRLPRVCA